MFLKLLLSVLPLFAVAQNWEDWGNCRNDGICAGFERQSDCWNSNWRATWRCCICQNRPPPSPPNPPPQPAPPSPHGNPVRPPDNCDPGRDNGYGCQGENSCWTDSEGHQCSYYVQSGWQKTRCWESYQSASISAMGVWESASSKCCTCSWQYQGLRKSGRKSGQKADASKVSSSEE